MKTKELITTVFIGIMLLIHVNTLYAQSSEIPKSIFYATQSTFDTPANPETAIDNDLSSFTKTLSGNNKNPAWYSLSSSNKTLLLDGIKIASSELNDYYIFFSKKHLWTKEINFLLADPEVNYIHITEKQSENEVIPLDNIEATNITIINNSNDPVLLSEVTTYGQVLKAREIVQRSSTTGLSQLGEDVLTAVSNTNTQGVEPIFTTDNRLVDVLVDGPEIYEQVRMLIEDAEFEIDIALYVWDDDDNFAGNQIKQGLLANEALRQPGDPIPLLRIMVAGVNLITGVTNAEKIYRKLVGNDDGMNGINEQLWDIQITAAPGALDGFLVGNLHNKLFVIDGKKMIVTGANAQSKNDPGGDEWRDTGYWIEGDAGLSGLSDFDVNWMAFDYTHLYCQSGYCIPIIFGIKIWSIPNRPWLESVNVTTGVSNIIYAGRMADNNPQNAAWLALMNNARSEINIASPNIMSQDFENAIIDAVIRGVTVNLITGRLFNAGLFTNIVDGYNRESVSTIKQAIRNHDPALLNNLNIKWYSNDGLREIIANGDNAMHTKFMSVDDQVAMVGSGNQDAFSWNHSTEINFVIDCAADVAMMHQAFFDNDFNNGIDQVIEFYEGNNVTQDIVAIENTQFNHSQDFTQDDQVLLGLFPVEYYSVNDEARSAVINHTAANKRIRIFNSTDPNDQFTKSWTEIITKQPLNLYNINSFETTYEDSQISVTYNPNYDDDHLDGKVSYVEITDYTPQPRLLLYEGNNATQSIICDILVDNPVNNLDFTTYTPCPNDEARSVKLLDMQANTSFVLAGNPDGSTDEGYVIIEILNDFTEMVIGTFEQSFENSDIRVTFVGSGSSLDGKISSFSNTNIPQSEIILYEGNNGTQDIVCSIQVGNLPNGYIDFTGNTNVYSCANDEARSAALLQMKQGDVFKLFDSPGAVIDDDYVVIEILTDFDFKIINSFEQNFSDSEIRVSYFHKNGLDGKVSAFDDTDRSMVVLYEGNYATQDVVCAIPVQNALGHLDFTSGSSNLYSCANDEARSALLLDMKAGNTYKLYDHPNALTSDDYIEITILQDFSFKIIDTFESSFSDPDLVVTYHSNNGLDGKVSSFRDY